MKKGKKTATNKPPTRGRAKKPAKPKTVVVCGDLIWNHYLVQHEDAPRAHHEATVFTVVRQHCGGAWYTRDLIHIACSDLGEDAVSIRCAPLSGTERPAADAIVSDAYQVCCQFEHTKGSKDKKTWRIRDFLGCHRPVTAAHALAVERDVRDPHVLVVDDVNLGFNREQALWPLALEARGNPKRVVYKTSAFPDSPLWKELLKRFANRMTVVMPVDALRTKCAAISKALSWDQTIEDVVREFANGACTGELARCRRVIVHFGPAGAACLSRIPLYGVPVRRPDRVSRRSGLRSGRVTLERFVYRPDEPEDAWYEKHPGLTFGVSPMLAAAIARHELAPKTYPLFTAVARALGAARYKHEVGGGSDNEFRPDAADGRIEEAYHRPTRRAPYYVKVDPADEYFSSFSHALLTYPLPRGTDDGRYDLLRDLTGGTDEYVAAKAIEVVTRGPKEALAPAPVARHGRYLTADRQEIERINAVRNLIIAYRDKKEDSGKKEMNKPLPIAVFGPPGSGKSFAIRELAKELFGEEQRTLEFNMSQFNSVTDIHHAYHEVSDATVRGVMPLVFWDEFDTTLNDEQFFWLRHFLEPMQDGTFRSGGASHPLGKAIFVFAGGRCRTYFNFTAGCKPDEPESEQERRGRWNAFVAHKGRDFVSRLQGYVNIKGPDPHESNVEGGDTEHPASDDPAFLVRRALLLRGQLERHHKHLLDSSSAQVSPGVISAFLRVDSYIHGARSLEAVVRTSTVGTDRYFGPAHLPPKDQLEMHVRGDFLGWVSKGELSSDLLDSLARTLHDAYIRCTKGKPVHYGSLTKEEKENKLTSARVTRAKLLEVGIRIERKPASGGSPRAPIRFSKKELYRLARIEHDRWMREKMQRGFEYARKRDGALRLNPCAVPFRHVPRKMQRIDYDMTKAIPPGLWEQGYMLVRSKKIASMSVRASPGRRSKSAPGKAKRGAPIAVRARNKPVTQRWSRSLARRRRGAHTAQRTPSSRPKPPQSR